MPCFSMTILFAYPYIHLKVFVGNICYGISNLFFCELYY